MKKTLITLFCCLGWLMFANTTTYGQETGSTQPDSSGIGTMSTKPRPVQLPPPPNGGNITNAVSNPAFNACAFKPDLEITTFTTGTVTPGATEGSGATQTRRYAIKFTATIKNSGGVAAGVCKLESQFSRFDQNTFFWGGYYNVNALNANGTQTINGVINVRVPATHEKVKLQLLIDSAAGEEFLPPFNKVDECKETNNTAPVATVKLK
ncbi:MAG TPA: CARDB domain-containing protein [Chitinophagales bacterium]|nr:CARDB domain-containing protein [Chitinophagales bacterium]HRK28518.1 CARDB domain-containing protein [Chitinophagales bacterium]